MPPSAPSGPRHQAMFALEGTTGPPSWTLPRSQGFPMASKFFLAWQPVLCGAPHSYTVQAAAIAPHCKAQRASSTYLPPSACSCSEGRHQHSVGHQAASGSLPWLLQLLGSFPKQLLCCLGPAGQPPQNHPHAGRLPGSTPCSMGEKITQRNSDTCPGLASVRFPASGAASARGCASPALPLHHMSIGRPASGRRTL